LWVLGMFAGTSSTPTVGDNALGVLSIVLSVNGVYLIWLFVDGFVESSAVPVDTSLSWLFLKFSRQSEISF